MKLGTRFWITLFNLTVCALCWLFVVSSVLGGVHSGSRTLDHSNLVRFVLSCLAYPLLAFVTVASSVASVASFVRTMTGRIAWRQAQTLLAWTLWGVAAYIGAGLLTFAPLGIGILAWITTISVFIGAAWLASECARYTRPGLK